MASDLPPPPPGAPSGPAGGAGGPNRRLIAGLGAAAMVAAAVVVSVVALGGEDSVPGAGPTTSPTATASPTGATGATGPTSTPEPTGPTLGTGATGTATPEATGPAAFADATPITIPDSGASSPYPAVIEVSGLAGTIADLNVTLEGMTHSFPDDVDVLLVGPTGVTAVLMADVGGDGANALDDLTLTFDDSALDPLPDRAPLQPEPVRPTSGTAAGRDGSCCDFAGGPPAPSPPYGQDLAAFAGTDPNGTWSLFVFDDTGGDVGEIADGWSLEITLAV